MAIEELRRVFNAAASLLQTGPFAARIDAYVGSIGFGQGDRISGAIVPNGDAEATIDRAAGQGGLGPPGVGQAGLQVSTDRAANAVSVAARRRPRCPALRSSPS
ncbi:MAG: hypothetical protein M9905_16220 [Rhizobiaceae bacterium]|nr:hypothetical protein [Rhizobiaceae bacterium]